MLIIRGIQGVSAEVEGNCGTRGLGGKLTIIPCSIYREFHMHHKINIAQFVSV